VLDFVALGFHKQFGPENELRHVVCANKFGFRVAVSVQFLFADMAVGLRDLLV